MPPRKHRVPTTGPPGKSPHHVITVVTRQDPKVKTQNSAQKWRTLPSVRLVLKPKAQGLSVFLPFVNSRKGIFPSQLSSHHMTPRSQAVGRLPFLYVSTVLCCVKMNICFAHIPVSTFRTSRAGVLSSSHVSLASSPGPGT